MTMMAAVRYDGPGQVSLVEMPVPVPARGEMLVRVDVCGVCATDAKTFRRGHPLIKPPTVLGHEIAGTVVVPVPPFREGEPVVVAPYVPCYACPYCRRGHHTLCSNLFRGAVEPGGFAQFVRVPASLVRRGTLRIPAGLPPEAASLSEPLACCVHALRPLLRRKGESVLILGDGPMGIMLTLVARAMGAARVLVAGRTPSRLAMASDWADAVLDTQSGDLRTWAREQTDGLGAGVVVVAVGTPEAGVDGLSAVRRGGQVSLFGGMPSGSTVAADAGLIHYGEVSLTGAFGFEPRSFRAALDMLASGAVPGARLLTGTRPLSEVPAALADSLALNGLRSVIRCQEV